MPLLITTLIWPPRTLDTTPACTPAMHSEDDLEGRRELKLLCHTFRVLQIAFSRITKLLFLPFTNFYTHEAHTASTHLPCPTAKARLIISRILSPFSSPAQIPSCFFWFSLTVTCCTVQQSKRWLALHANNLQTTIWNQGLSYVCKQAWLTWTTVCSNDG